MNNYTDPNYTEYRPMQQTVLPLMLTAGLAAGLMYFFDPSRGHKRRQRLRDQTLHRLDQITGDGLGEQARRSLDRVAEAGSSLRHEAARRLDRVGEAGSHLREEARDRVGEWVERGRSMLERDHAEHDDDTLEVLAHKELKRHVRYPEAIDIQAKDGELILSGAVLAKDETRLVKRLAELPGVDGVDNRLDVYRHGKDLERRRRGKAERRAFSRRAAAGRLLSALGGGVLWWYGNRRRDRIGNMARVAGMGLATRALAKMG